jgi:hypothetical protein
MKMIPWSLVRINHFYKLLRKIIGNLLVVSPVFS